MTNFEQCQLPLSPKNDCPYTDVTDLEPFESRALHFMHLNIRSFIKNEDNFKCLIDDFILREEIWILSCYVKLFLMTQTLLLEK